MVEVARFFASLATYDARRRPLRHRRGDGPDEFHDGYPDAPGQGVRNNAYTNVHGGLVLAGRPGGGGPAGRARLRPAVGPAGDCGPASGSAGTGSARRLRVPFHADGVISQFEGYEQLAEFDWEDYRARYGDIGRLDLILAAEGDSPNRYRLSKQADVLMLLYLFSAEELRALLERMGYPFPPEAVPRTVEFYLRPHHPRLHAEPARALLGRWPAATGTGSWSLFTQALDSDLADIQGGTTREGVHLGAMAGTVDMVLRCYGGLEIRDDVLWLHPALPPELPRVAFEIAYRGQPISVEITRGQVRLHLHPHTGSSITVCVEDQISVLYPGDVHTVDLATAGGDRGA